MTPLYSLKAPWSVASLQELCSGGDASIQTGPFGSQLHASDYVEDGIPCVMPQDIRNGRVSIENVARISEDDHRRLHRFHLREGDIVYPRRGDISKRALIGRREAGWLCGTGCLRIRPNKSSVVPSFLAYYLSHPDVCAWIEGNAVGATMPHLNTGLAGSIPVTCPSPAEQQAIAEMLGALDDKIQLNRVMSAVLEELARALYRSWFVSFDPVHAKSQNRPPAHMDPATAALFPNRFGENGLPDGWEMGTLADNCDHVKKTVKPMDAPNDPFLHFSLPAFDNGRIPVLENGEAIKSNKAFVPHDAILFSRLNPTIPRVWWAKTEWSEATPAASTEFYIATAKQPIETPWLYCLLSSPAFRDDALSRVTGTSNSHQRVPPKVLAEVDVVQPRREIIEAFGQLTGCWFDKCHSVSKENQTLAAFRDTLLPRLMSGELRVGEALERIEDIA